MPGVLLSYACADGEERDGALRERLSRDAPDIKIQRDLLFLERAMKWQTASSRATAFHGSFECQPSAQAFGEWIISLTPQGFPSIHPDSLSSRRSASAAP